MKTNLKPAYIYQLKDFINSSLVLCAVMLLIIAASVIGAFNFDSDIAFSGFGASAAIFMFVFGIVAPRQSLRLCIQFGVSRRTSFIGEIMSALTISFILAVFGELLISVASLFNSENLFFADFYQMFYLNDKMDLSMTFGHHMTSIIFSMAIFIFTFCFGMFFTYIFWRLNKIWTIVVALSIPLLLNVIPILGYRLYKVSAPTAKIGVAFADFVSSSPWNAMLIFVIVAVIMTAINWMLVRRANIKAPVN